MTQELVYSIIPRPALMPENLVFKRKVQALAKTIKAQKTRGDDQDQQNINEHELNAKYRARCKSLIDELA